MVDLVSGESTHEEALRAARAAQAEASASLAAVLGQVHGLRGAGGRARDARVCTGG